MAVEPKKQMENLFQWWSQGSLGGTHWCEMITHCCSEVRGFYFSIFSIIFAGIHKSAIPKNNSSWNVQYGRLVPIKLGLYRGSNMLLKHHCTNGSNRLVHPRTSPNVPKPEITFDKMLKIGCQFQLRSLVCSKSPAPLLCLHCFLQGAIGMILQTELLKENRKERILAGQHN